MNSLRITIFWLCVVIVVTVFSGLIYSIIKQRRAKNASSTHFHKRISAEILWTVIPFVILILIAMPAVKVLLYG